MFERGSEYRYWLWMHTCLTTASRTFYYLISEYRSAKAVFEAAAERKIVQTNFISKAAVDRLNQGMDEDKIDEYIARYEAKGIRMVASIDPNYPRLLAEIFDSPSILYYKGELHPELDIPIAVIGARKCTDYGRRVARTLSKQLVDFGGCVISGLAYGIDTEAAMGALKSKASDYATIAVLGSSFDSVYPKANEKLARQIEERGAVVTEFPNGYPTTSKNFPARNRVISGLSRGVMVVEAGEKSGTSITVDYALEQGRDVFAVPGRLTDEMSFGTNRMIREGTAKPVFGINDILEEYNLHAEPNKTLRKEVKQTLEPDTLYVYEVIKKAPINFDELCIVSGDTPAMLNCILTELEFSSLISQSLGRVYTAL